MKNRIYIGADGRSSLVDLTIPSTFSGKLIVFVHGYMGFKDWGCWNAVEQYFLELGFGFCKYNVSHNGCTTTDAVQFVDLDAFSQNNYSKECFDLNAIFEWISSEVQPFPELYVIGHSRGGGIGILKSVDPRVKKLATWAAISDIERRFPQQEEFRNWQETGYYFRKNGRTGQEMPHHFSQFIDFQKNSEELNIRQVAEKNVKPWLILHGDSDTSVPLTEGQELAAWSGRELEIIEGADHTFGSAHPWEGKKMPEKLEEICRLTAAFFLGIEG